MTQESDVRHRISLTALLLGVGLLWALPLAAAVLMVAATFALVISVEENLDVARSPAPIDPLAPHSIPRLWKETQ